MREIMEEIQITLSRNDIGQLLEGVEVLIEQWEATEVFLSTGVVDENACIRDAHQAHEAAAIAKTYRDIAEHVRRQLPVHN